MPEATATGTPGNYDADPAVMALHDYLRQQALAINARTSSAADVPAFLATLTPQAKAWALPLLAANIGNDMPGPYPIGVLALRRASETPVELTICTQDRGWQLDPRTHRTVNSPHYTAGRAGIVQVAGRWLVDSVTTDGTVCAAQQVQEERF
jgi:hypothetical protein